MKKELLGKIFIEKKLIDYKMLVKALAYQKRNGGKIGGVLVKLGFIKKEDLEKIILEKTGAVPFKNENIDVDEGLLLKFPKDLVQKYNAVPIREEKKFVYILTSDPFDLDKIDSLRFYFGKNLKIFYLTEEDFKEFLNKYISKNIISNGKNEVKEIFNKMLTRAINGKSSDIHLEQHGEKKVVRFRTNGILYDQPCKIPKDILLNLINYIKIISNLDITKHRIPQDGQFLYLFENREIPIRVSTFPTQYGEKIVLRLLYRNNNLEKLENLGMDMEVYNLFKRAISQLNGLVLVTGPTGSGKTTTLYAALDFLNTPEKNICTLEDPIEIRLSGIIQSQVDEKSGFTFAEGLRGLLRQDPDIIMVGEIRDEETAQIAANAALTGHLVLATLHTITSVGAIYRLKEMGVKPEILSQSLNCVLNQRLLKKLCPYCKELNKKEEMIPFFEIKINTYISKGCDKCNGTGISGRIGLYEIFYSTDKAKEELRKEYPENLDSFILNPLWKQGFKLLKEGIVSLKDYLENVRIPSQIKKDIEEKEILAFHKKNFEGIDLKKLSF